MSLKGHNKKLSAAIIGTGFSGICAAIKLKKELDIDAQLFELSKDVGGTWYSNTYPGAECDIPSHLYSLSFELNDTWTKHYSGQAEIHEYLRKVARKHNLYEKTKFQTEIIHAEWKEKEQKWFLKWRNTNNHQETSSASYDVLFSGLGPLRVPNIPKEFSKFQGPIVHTAQWDSTIDYTNKRIAIIGSGATAVQVIPQIRKVASHVYSYQRTRAWTIIRDQFSYPRIIKFIFRWLPFLMRFYRILLFFQHEAYYVAFGYYKSLIARSFQKAMAKVLAWRLKRVGRSDLLPILTPDYPIGCKRVAKSETYVEALAKPNVTVIPYGVSDIKGRTLIDKEGNETEVDILILATGFDTQGFTGNLDIYGRNHTLLDEKWRKEFPKTYKTVTVHGYPNFFSLLAASSVLGHNTVVAQVEIQVDYSIQCLKHMIKNNLAALEPKASAQERFSKELQKSFDGTVWKGGCNSWYLNDAGEVYGLWSGTIISFYWALRKPDFRDFIEYKKTHGIDMSM